MLSRSSYTQEYIDASRAAIGAQVAAYRDLVAAAQGGGAQLASAIEAFEPRCFNHMVLALDSYFCHRARGMEGKDGNPLNEARVLCTSLMEHGGVFTADKTIKLTPESSLLHHAPGDEVRLSEADFALLADAFFAEIELRFT